MKRRKHKNLLTAGLAWLLLMLSILPVHAQQAPEGNTAPEPPAPGETVGRSTSLGRQSMLAPFLENRNNVVGFAVGVSESYSNEPSLATTGSGVKSSYATVVQPRIFTTLTRTRSQLTLDYSFGMSRYSQPSHIRTSTQSAVATYERRLSKNVSLTLGDTFYSTPNDIRNFVGAFAIPTSESTFSDSLEARRQRVIRNNAVFGIGYRFSKRGSIGVFGSHDVYIYGEQKDANTNGYSAGLKGNIQISKWITLESSYSRSLSQPKEGAHRNNIHRLNVAGLQLRSRRGWEFGLKGGAEFAEYTGTQTRSTVGFQTGISKSFGLSLLSFGYHSGFARAVGPGLVLDGHTFSMAVRQMVTRRISLTMSSQYVRSSSLLNTSTQTPTATQTSTAPAASLKYLYSTTQLGIVLHSHLMLSGDYAYNWQKGVGLPDQFPALNRTTASVGLQYFLPSLLAGR